MSSFAPSRLTAVARSLALAGVMCGAWVAPTQAVTVTEIGDAGQSQSTAQVTSAAAGSLTDIFGTLTSSIDADLYVINITNPGSFSATTLSSPSQYLDTTLFLLTLAGAPVFFNDDDAGGLSVQSTLSAGSSFGPSTAGMYILGVAMSGYLPVNINDQALFAMGGSTTAIYGPASGLQPAALGGFFDSTFYPDSGAYDIHLTGAIAATVTTIPAVPEPSSTALLLLGGAACAYAGMRRRKSAVAGAAATTATTAT